MCLSKVIHVTKNGEKQLCDAVCKIHVDGDRIQLLDILGKCMDVEGKIIDIDLIDNQIRVTGIGT